MSAELFASLNTRAPVLPVIQSLPPPVSFDHTVAMVLRSPQFYDLTPEEKRVILAAQAVVTSLISGNRNLNAQKSTWMYQQLLRS